MSKYISLENLERYDAKMQERIASFCASKEDGMWRQTEKAGAVAFWPVGNSPLEGTVEFMFKETGPASGTKSPDNPSTISGVSSIGLTVCQEEGVDEHSYSLSLGGTYYGGSIDLATGLMTVTHSRVVYDGTETVGVGGSSYHYYYFSEFQPRIKDRGAFSTTHFNVVASGASFAMCNYGSETQTRFGWTSGAYSYWESTSAVQSWLASQYAAGTPLTVVYELYSPFTVQLTAPQIRSLIQPDKYVPRINTVYSDADAVQIVYQKNPVRDKFEKVQAIIAQGGNV